MFHTAATRGVASNDLIDLSISRSTPPSENLNHTSCQIFWIDIQKASIQRSDDPQIVLYYHATGTPSCIFVCAEKKTVSINKLFETTALIEQRSHPTFREIVRNKWVCPAFREVYSRSKNISTIVARVFLGGRSEHQKPISCFEQISVWGI